MVVGLELDGAAPAEAPLDAVRVVPPVDVAEQCQLGLLTGTEAGAVDQLDLQGGEEVLGQRVVIAVADRAHRGAHAGVVEALGEPDGGVLAAAVGVVDEPGLGRVGLGPAGTGIVATPQPVLQRSQHQARVGPAGGLPAHDPPGAGVADAPPATAAPPRSGSARCRPPTAGW